MWIFVIGKKCGVIVWFSNVIINVLLVLKYEEEFELFVVIMLVDSDVRWKWVNDYS